MGQDARRRLLGTLALVAALGVGFATGPAGGSGRPARFVIANVPQVAQLDYSGCGAAALAMALGHSGPAVDYKEVVDVVRSMAHGTSLPDMVRGGHFSEASAAVSEAYPGSQPAHGYSTRKLGNGSFFFASRTPWLDQLKDVIAQGFPVVVLTDWKPGESGPHYRVVTGYDDSTGVLYLHDPWPYGTSLEKYAKPGAISSTWPYADFLAVWALPTDQWGLRGYRYGAVVSIPWKVRVQAPATVTAGESFTVTVNAEYCCPKPFGRGPEPVFPSFPATTVQFALQLPPGLTAAGGTLQPARNGTLRAGEVSSVARFTVTASKAARGDLTLAVRASGRVSGKVPRWGTTGWSQPYAYQDTIGGQGAATLQVR